MHSFSSKIIDLKSSVWSHGFMVPYSVAEHYLKQNDKRVICKLNDQLKIHAALMPKGNNNWFITLNKTIRKKLGLTVGSEVSIRMETDSSKYGMEVCEEFEELLRQDENGRAVFETLTLGKRRTLIHQINQGKTSQTRLKKALVILEYLLENNGKLDYKSLNQAYKNSRYS